MIAPEEFCGYVYVIQETTKTSEATFATEPATSALTTPSEDKTTTSEHVTVGLDSVIKICCKLSKIHSHKHTHK